MNKKLIAAAIAAAMAAPVVSAADTTLYGKAHVDIRSNDNGTTDNYTVNSNASRIGIKGSEDLGDGLKAIFGFEMDYNMTDSGTGVKGNGGGNPITSRNSFVGLSGGFGTFLVGRHDTPAKIALNSAGLSAISDSIVDFESGLAFTEFRINNAIAYVSPSFSGFTVAAAVVPGEESGTPGFATTTLGDKFLGTAVVALPYANTNDGLADAYSLGAMYAGGGLKAGVGYEVVSDGAKVAGVTDDHKMWQFAGSYTFGDFMVGAAYEKSTDFFTIKGLDKTVWGVHAKGNFGNNFVFANYGNAEYDVSGVGDDSVDTFGIGVGHNFSKRTQVYAAYSNNDGGGTASPIGLNVDTTQFALGMIHNF